jgi:hypothetical protein
LLLRRYATPFTTTDFGGRGILTECFVFYYSAKLADNNKRTVVKSFFLNQKVFGKSETGIPESEK